MCRNRSPLLAELELEIVTSWAGLMFPIKLTLALDVGEEHHGRMRSPRAVLIFLFLLAASSFSEGSSKADVLTLARHSWLWGTVCRGVVMGVSWQPAGRDAPSKGNRLKADCEGEAAPCYIDREWLQKWHLIIQH